MAGIPLNPRLLKADIEQVPTRNGYGEALLELGSADPNVFVLTADLAESTRVLEFAKKYPERFVECGVAEQNMMGVAAGLALTGKTAFVSSYATFSPGRNWDQFRVSVCYSKANVKVAGHHTGLSVGPDGATHQALEDVALVRVLPNVTVVVPCDALEARRATVAVARLAGPAYLRLTREKTPVMTVDETPFEIGKAYELAGGTDVAIIGAGPILYEALLAAGELKERGISALVLNCHTVKPIDADAVAAAAKACGAVVTVEEHQIHGGIGSAVAEVLARRCPVPVEFVGMPDTFGESGQPGELFKKYGLDAAAIVAAAVNVTARKKIHA